MALRTYAATQVGLGKKRNEDRSLIKEACGGVLLVVADGMGGNPGGGLAAQLLIDSLGDFVPPIEAGGTLPQQLTTAVLQANAALLRVGDETPDLAGMGSTLILAWLAGDQTAHWAHVGDSRLYHLHEGALTQVTTDQNLAQELHAKGEITVEELRGHRMRAFLSQCLGEDGVEPIHGRFTVDIGDLLLLCSDGLHDWLSNTDILGILSLNADMQDIAARLIAAAVEAGSSDDITVVLARV